MRIRALAAASVLCFAATLLAQTPAKTAPRRENRPPAPALVAISPDGTTLAYTVRGREGSTLHLSAVSDPDPAKDKIVTPNTETACSNSSPVWSPDSQTLAFTSTCTAKEEKPGPEQIFLWSRADGAIKQLTHLTGNINQPAWSPDGKSLAFLFVENATRSAGATDAMKPWAGVIGEDGVEVQRVYAVNVADSKGYWLTREALHVYEFTWSPNSNQIAFIAANPPGENTWWIAKLYKSYVPRRPLPIGQMCVSSDIDDAPCPKGDEEVVFDPTATKTALHGLQIAVPRYSPDGKRLAVIGGLMSDQGSTGGDIWVVNADGKGTPTDITPNIDGTPTYEAWLDDDTIGFVEDRRGSIVLPDYKVSTRTMVPGSDTNLGQVSLSGGPIKNAASLSLATKTIAYVKSGYNLPPEIYLLDGPTGKETQFTHFSEGTKPSTTRFESIEWENEGFHVQGWLTYPDHYDPKKKYPMIVTVHGGPSASAGPRPDTLFSSLGYFVFAPNPRGSFGQGEAFTMANRKDFGYGDLRDILTGVDAVEKKVNIDEHRLGLTGWSYGGFMSMFAETQTNRFAAIVAGAGISNWQSYYGENSIDQWMVPFFGASVYDDPAIYAKSSAINFIKNAKTPMLIIVGDRDGECPAPQSFEMWHALKAVGVKTQLVIYPNEGHHFRDPAHTADYQARMIKWFADNMPAKD